MTRANRQLLTLLALVVAIGAFVWQSGALTLGSAPLMEVAEVESPSVDAVSSHLPAHVEAGSRILNSSGRRRELGQGESEDSGEFLGDASVGVLPEPQSTAPGVPGAGEILVFGYVLDRPDSEFGFDINARCGEFRVETKTDHLGNFQMRIPHGGNYWFTVNGHDRRLIMRRELSERFGQMVELEFDGSRIEGVVQSVEGDLLSGIQVSLTWVPKDNSSIPTYPSQAITGEDGRFRFDHVPSGQFFVAANKSKMKGNHWQTAESATFVVLRGVDLDELKLELEPKPELADSPLPGRIELDRGRFHGRSAGRDGQ